ncbi:MAG: Fic family protein [Candidatus Eremiobacteraeota bacterium]|nr:Fic family protein [Candidatus Eremiobacteraeota bacterium]MBC5826268.1 Fic family protein [Candidatus Eremiobacteraeota bacterium]
MRNFVLEELADALDDRSGQFRYFFIASSGRVEPYAVDDPAALHLSARTDATLVRPLSHAQSHQIIVDFIDTLADAELAARLREAALGAAPATSGRFQQLLRAYPRARRSWIAYRQRRLEAIALDWLRSHAVDLTHLGLDRVARPNEEIAGLRFDETLEKRLTELREHVKALEKREGMAGAKVACRMDMRIDEIYHSNAVRGNRLSRGQTRDVLVRSICVGGLTLREHLEAVNLHRALDRSELQAVSPAPVTEHGIRELHALLFASIDDENAGVYRRIDTRVVGRDYLPPESVLVPALLREFTEWLEEAHGDPVAKATAAQAKILNISPFLDGNGRVGRLLSNLILCQADYPPAIVRVEDGHRYYDGLRQADAGDMSRLLELMIERVQDSFTRLTAALDAPAEA